MNENSDIFNNVLQIKMHVLYDLYDSVLKHYTAKNFFFQIVYDMYGKIWGKPNQEL